MSVGKLIFICGKMGAGKTTLSKNLEREHRAILISEDEWLTTLYPGEINTLVQYSQYSERLKTKVKPLVHSILMSGATVVLDFPANTKTQRAWFKDIVESARASHQLIYIESSNERCLANIKHRALVQPERAKTDTPEMFVAVTQYFVPPSEREGLTVCQITGDDIGSYRIRS